VRKPILTTMDCGEVQSAMQTKVWFFSTYLTIIALISKGKSKWQWKSQARKSYVTVMLYITANGNKLQSYIMLNRQCQKTIFAKR
jgi:hypothetical protein